MSIANKSKAPCPTHLINKMDYIKWHARIVQKYSHTSIYTLVAGKLIVLFTIGSYLSIQLVTYGYFILLAATLLLTTYLIHNFMSWHIKEEIIYKDHILGGLGLFLLILFVGIQSPQIPGRKYILILGFVLFLPLVYEYFRKRKRLY